MRAVFVMPGVDIAPITEAFVVNASRAQHVLDVIEPAIARGAIVLCDRYSDATLAYQGYGRGIDLTTLRTLVAHATGGRCADLTLLVDIDVARSRARVASRANASGDPIDRLEREDNAFHERVRAGYLALAKEQSRIHVLDGALEADALLGLALPLVLSAIDER